jgi:16S rRNA (guanine(966)-N(2))-methyltransferase RsmD
MTLRIIAGAFKGRLLKAPQAKTTRPTQGMLREAVFNICQTEVVSSRFLDLFAGSGAMALEALSRGASHVTLVEQNRQAAICIKENINILQVQSQATLIPTDATRALTLLTKNSSKFDIVYIDPPYDTPFNLEPLIPLLAPHAIVFVEERHQPKKPHQPLHNPHLQLKDTRRFGIALLSTFLYNSES